MQADITGGKPAVVLIEGNPELARRIRSYLVDRGYGVSIASDAVSGLRALGQELPDIVVLDYDLPDRDGLEVLSEIVVSDSAPSVIVLGTERRTSVMRDAFKLGATDFITIEKDTDYLAELQMAIDEALRKREETRALRAAREESARWMRELQQRLRELGCLYGVEKLLSVDDPPSPWLFSTLCDIVAGACQSVGVSVVRLQTESLVCCSKNWQPTPWYQQFRITRQGAELGVLEVGWLVPQMPRPQLFLPEEEDLLQGVADRIGTYLDRWRYRSVLSATQDELRRLYRAVEQSATAVLITNADGVIEYVNPAFVAMTGYSREEALGQTPRILKSGEMRPEDYREMWRVLKSGKEWRGEFHNRRKDGTLYWDYSIISPITNEYGEVTHFVAVKQDITSQKEIERLREALLKISAQLAGCEGEDAICLTVVEGIRKWMDIDRCGLFLLQPDGVTFRGTYGTDMQGRTTDEHDRVWDVRRDSEWEDLFASGTFRSGFPLGNPPAMPGEEGLSATLIALRHGGELFGMISVDNRIRRRNVSEAQMMHIALLAEVIGSALRAARARSQLRRLLEEQQRALAEIEMFNRAMLGRENRIIELKEEVNALLRELGRPPRYEPVWVYGTLPSQSASDHA